MSGLEIPKLNHPQCSVIQAEAKSGIILTIEGKYCLNTSKDEYLLIFDSFEEAKRFCDQKVIENPTVEFLIYSHQAEIIETIRT